MTTATQLMSQDQPSPEVDPAITPAVITALGAASSAAAIAAKKTVEEARYWMIGKIQNTTEYDLKIEHSYAQHGEFETSPPKYIRGYTQLADNYLKLAQTIFGKGITSLDQLTDVQVANLVAAAQKENSGSGDEDEENFGILAMESTGAGVEGVATYDVVGHSLYVCFLIDNPQGASTKKAGCSIMSKKAFDQAGYQNHDDGGEALISHMFYYTTGKTKVVSNGSTAEVSHSISGGTLKVSWTVAHETTFTVEFIPSDLSSGTATRK